jgi:hypothetical protein
MDAARLRRSGASGSIFLVSKELGRGIVKSPAGKSNYQGSMQVGEAVVTGIGRPAPAGAEVGP